jgi:hypothetical protein
MNISYLRPRSCRDKGRGGVDEGALCLSWLGCDLVAPRLRPRSCRDKGRGGVDEGALYLS